MTNQEIQSYKEMGIPVRKERRKRYTFTLAEIVEYCLIFLLNKIFLLGAISPFGLSFYAAAFPKEKKSLGLAAACLGVLAVNMGIFSLKYIGALVIVTTFCILMEKEFLAHHWLYGLVSSLAVLLTGMVFVLFNGFLMYDFLLLVLEAVLVFLSFFAFDKAVTVLRGAKERKIFEPLESLSMVALASGVILSLHEIPFLQGVAHVISLLIIFVAGMAGGFSLSCATGLTLGLVNSVSDVLPAQVVAVYGVSALCSGLLQKKGRWGVLIGFFVANILSTLYFSQYTNVVVTLSCVVASGIFLFAIPDRFLSMYGEVMKAPSYQEDSVLRIREIMEDKLTEVSESFSELSGIFNEAVAKRVDSEVRDPGPLFDRTADKVCRGCSLMNYCWQKEYNQTRHFLLTLYNRMELRGYGDIEDVPEKFKHKCIRIGDFMETLNKHYDVHKVNLLWAGRVAESRSLVAEQFKNVSSVLAHLKRELVCQPADSIRLERKIAAALDRAGIDAKQVRVLQGDGLEVSLVMDSCGGDRICSNRVAAAISGAVGMPMLKLPSACGTQSCRLKFLERARYSVEAGFAQTAGQNGHRSGDYHMSSVSADGRYILALSDGMGRGGSAEAQSSMTIHLIRRLIDSGFDKETALRLINSVLMVSAERESFATADLCLMNLYSGALEFIKIGATSSYVKRREEVEKIGCTSLPAGILADVEPDCDLCYAKAGDMVVLVTDGVTDVLENGTTSHISKLIQDYQGASPQELADTILRTAVEAGGGTAKDDMTVLVAKLSEA